MQDWVLLKKIYLYWYASEMISTHFANLAVQQQQQSIFAAQFWRTRAETWHQNTRDVTSWLLVATKNTPTCVTTLKSLIEEHAPLDFSDFLSTLFAIFHVIKEKFDPGDFFSKPACYYYFMSFL